MRKLLFLFLLVLFPFANAFGQQSLTTLFNTNNSRSGAVFFDIENVSPHPITIVSWDTNVSCDGPTVDYSVYTRSGTSQGFEGTPVGWMLVGTETDIVCAGDNLPTPINVGGFVVNPGDTTGIALVIETPGDFRNLYTNGDGTNQDYNNGQLEIRTGSSLMVPFDGGIAASPRVWNGTVFYVAPRPIPTLSQWGIIAMAGVLGIVGFMVIRTRKATA